MKKIKQKKIFLDHLRKIPIIQVACEKSGIGRTTVYRWKKQSKKFACDMEKAIEEGEELINDMGESQLISLIRERNFAAVRFWLTNRHSKFCDRLEVTGNIKTPQNAMSPEQQAVVAEALCLASLNVDEGVKEVNNKPK